MAKFKVGDMVIPHEFESGTDGITYVPIMRVRTGIPGTIIEISKYGGYRVHGYLWPESALTTYDPPPAPGMTTPSDGSVHDAQARHEFDNWSAQPQLSKPRYDLKEFTLAAMQGLCANSGGVMTEDSRRSFHPDDISKVAVIIAQQTIKSLQESEKEARP